MRRLEEWLSKTEFGLRAVCCSKKNGPAHREHDAGAIKLFLSNSVRGCILLGDSKNSIHRAWSAQGHSGNFLLH